MCFSNKKDGLCIQLIDGLCYMIYIHASSYSLTDVGFGNGSSGPLSRWRESITSHQQDLGAKPGTEYNSNVERPQVAQVKVRICIYFLVMLLEHNPIPFNRVLLAMQLLVSTEGIFMSPMLQHAARELVPLLTGTQLEHFNPKWAKNPGSAFP